jgi:PAS domain S-box-containing protein
MQSELHELFLLATRFFYKKYKQSGGSQGKLAEKLGITNSYLSSVISGARQASLDLQNQIATTLYGPYDKFLAIGRRIKDGLDPLEEENEQTLDPVEKLLAQLTHYVIDHQRIEKELQISQEKFRDISLTSGDMIFEMDGNFKFVYLSGRVYEVTGKNPEDIIGKHFSEFFDTRENVRLMELVNDCIQKNTILNTVLTISNGQERKYRHLIAKPVISPEGKFIGARGTYRDITERKKLEKALEQQNWLLQVALDSVENCGIIIIAADRTVLKWNLEYKRLTCLSDKVLKTRDSRKYLQESRKLVADTAHFDKGVAEAMQSKSPINHTFKLLDGRTLERKVIPLYKDNILIGMIAHIKNIHEGD